MNKTPKSLRLQIALMGRTNSGKSTLLNLLTGQEAALTSPHPGTTTDVVEKNQELPPLGPVTWLDTPGFGDTTPLGAERAAQSNKVFERADIIVLVYDGDKSGSEEEYILQQAKQRHIPVICVHNKSDRPSEGRGIWTNALNKAGRDDVLQLIKSELLKACPEEFMTPPPVLGDLVPPYGTVMLVIPVDFEAPKGRLILPQVQTIRDGLDHGQTMIMAKEDNYRKALDNLKTAPDLVVCDSQVVDRVAAETPDKIKCTTFSILFARLKGDLGLLVQGAATIGRLTDGDKVLIAESCTHHAAEDDIGKVKIPRWLKAKTQKDLQIDFVSGHDFPANLNEYKLVVQCGGCMFGRREILSRINQCQAAGIAITNYGVCISELKGVLEKALSPFPEALTIYKGMKNDQRTA